LYEFKAVIAYRWRCPSREDVLVTYFRYSKPKCSYGTRLVAAIVLQLVGTGLLASTFYLLDNFTTKPTVTLGQFAPCLLGCVAGFFFVACRRPATNQQLSLLASSFLAFGGFYWLASYSLPDLLLARLISGFGLGVVVARAFRPHSLENPVFPRIH
jgi:hypothetical protein